MKPYTFDQITRIVVERKTRRAALVHFAAIVSGLIRVGFRTQAVSAQALPLGPTCDDDADCSDTEVCGYFESASISLHYCCRPPSSQCIADDECCAGLFCINSACATGVPLPVAESSGAAASQAAACTLVELYPGYPGYRGFVAGLVGPGEVACLEELQRRFPWFDRAREDRENAAAAARLGLAGGPRDWVWENWMAIEAERGLPVTCYTCAAEKIAAGEPYQAAPADPTDIRLHVGSFGSNELLSRVAERHGIEMWAMESYFETDYRLRAIAWTAHPGHHINALELQSTYDMLGTAIAAGEAPGWEAWGIATAQGGYAPTPPQAAFEDQVFLLSTALETRSVGMNLSPLPTFNAIVAEWASERAKGSTQGLGAFMRENYPNFSV